MAELDDLLSASLKRAAEPEVTSAGVADAIRSRVAAGDTGTPAAVSGFGAGSGVLGWLPWIGLLVVAAVVGGALGLNGFAGREAIAVTTASHTAVLDVTTPGFACPGGPAVGQYPAGARVLAVQRSDDAAWLGVRDPRDLYATVWFPAGVVVVDAGAPETQTLPIGACPEVVVAQIEPTPGPAPTPTPGPTTPPAADPGPQPPSDTTAPNIGQYYAAPTSIVNSDPTVVHALAVTDNVGVTSVSISWTGPGGPGSASMTPVGGEWQYTWIAPDPNTMSNGNVVFTMQAFDAAGNASPQVQTAVYWQYFG